MNTNVDTNLELFLSIVEDIEEPCEHPSHSRSKNHGGKGEWYLDSKKCGTCGSDKGVSLVCDKFVMYLFAGGWVKCGTCNVTQGAGMEAYNGVKRKG